MTSCCGPSRDASQRAAPTTAPVPPGGMRVGAIRVPGGPSFVGTNAPEIPQDGEGPERPIFLDDFFLEATTVTNARFAAFVEATGYVTEAERFGWSSVFFGDAERLAAARAQGSGLPWWHRVDGATWRKPEGAGSTIETRLDHPVVQVSWTDATAFASWVGGRLPTEAEWEHAARGGALRRRFPWGDTEPNDRTIHANLWQGHFPERNTLADGYERTAPAACFDPNPLGFYNFSGNVWEWTQDAFHIHADVPFARQRNVQAQAYDEKVLKGGSFLCHISYCYRYRIAARMALTPDSATSNAGFRIAYDA